jgi:hypothetical protein
LSDGPALQLDLLKEKERTGRRESLCLWALLCFWVMPGLGLLLTMIVGFQQMDAGQESPASLLGQLMKDSWLVFSGAGVLVFCILLWRGARKDAAVEASEQPPK